MFKFDHCGRPKLPGKPPISLLQQDRLRRRLLGKAADAARGTIPDIVSRDTRINSKELPQNVRTTYRYFSKVFGLPKCDVTWGRFSDALRREIKGGEALSNAPVQLGVFGLGGICGTLQRSGLLTKEECQKIAEQIGATERRETFLKHALRPSPTTNA